MKTLPLWLLLMTIINLHQFPLNVNGITVKTKSETGKPITTTPALTPTTSTTTEGETTTFDHSTITATEVNSNEISNEANDSSAEEISLDLRKKREGGFLDYPAGRQMPIFEDVQQINWLAYNPKDSISSYEDNESAGSNFVNSRSNDDKFGNDDYVRELNTESMETMPLNKNVQVLKEMKKFPGINEKFHVYVDQKAPKAVEINADNNREYQDYEKALYEEASNPYVTNYPPVAPVTQIFIDHSHGINRRSYGSDYYRSLADGYWHPRMPFTYPKPSQRERNIYNKLPRFGNRQPQDFRFFKDFHSVDDDRIPNFPTHGSFLQESDRGDNTQNYRKSQNNKYFNHQDVIIQNKDKDISTPSDQNTLQQANPMGNQVANNQPNNEDPECNQRLGQLISIINQNHEKLNQQINSNSKNQQIKSDNQNINQNVGAIINNQPNSNHGDGRQNNIQPNINVNSVNIHQDTNQQQNAPNTNIPINTNKVFGTSLDPPPVADGINGVSQSRINGNSFPNKEVVNSFSDSTTDNTVVSSTPNDLGSSATGIKEFYLPPENHFSNACLQGSNHPYCHPVLYERARNGYPVYGPVRQNQAAPYVWQHPVQPFIHFNPYLNTETTTPWPLNEHQRNHSKPMDGVPKIYINNILENKYITKKAHPPIFDYPYEQQPNYPIHYSRNQNNPFRNSNIFSKPSKGKQISYTNYHDFSETDPTLIPDGANYEHNQNNLFHDNGNVGEYGPDRYHLNIDFTDKSNEDGISILNANRNNWKSYNGRDYLKEYEICGNRPDCPELYGYNRYRRSEVDKTVEKVEEKNDK